MRWIGKFNSLVSLPISIPYLMTCYLQAELWFMFAVLGYLWFLLVAPFLSLLQVTFIVNLIIKKDNSYFYQLKVLPLILISYLVFYLGLQNRCYVTA